MKKEHIDQKGVGAFASRVLLTLFLTCMISPLCAQLSIKGKVENVQQEPVENIHLLLYNVRDTVHAVQTALSDAKGRFALKGLQEGDYRLVASGVPYRTNEIVIQDLREDISSLTVILEEQVETLGEVTVTANSVVRQFDRQIIFPNEATRKQSTNGIDLIDNLDLDKVYVDKASQAIQSARGGKVMLRVNGAPADPSDILSVDPKRVTRVEYHDRPSMRYGEVDAVVDLYVKRWETGGRVNTYLRNGLDVANGTGRGDIRLNHKKSEFAIAGFYSYLKQNDCYATERENYLFEDGSQLARYKEGLPYTQRERMYTAKASYSYYDPGDILFSANVYYELFDTPNSLSSSRIYTDNKFSSWMNDSSTYREQRPSFELYFQKDMKHKQFIAFDVVGTYMDVSSVDFYRETEADTNIFDETLTRISGNKYSIIAEGIYEKRFEAGKLSAGAKEIASFADNTYGGTFDYLNKMNQYVTSAYAEWSGYKQKFSYGLGLGGVLYRTSYESEKETKAYVNPKLRLGYDFSRAVNLYYTFDIRVETPSLGNLNDVQVAEDTYHVLKGNPELKSVVSYNNGLSLYVRKGSFRSSLDANYNYAVHPILNHTYVDGHQFITQIQNEKNSHSFSLGGFLRWDVWRYLNVYGRFDYNYKKNAAYDYVHSLHSWMFDAGVEGSYRNFTLDVNFHKDRDYLSSESKTYAKTAMNLTLDYRWKNLRVGASYHQDFRDCMKRTVNLNQYTFRDTRHYTPDFKNFFTVHLAWAFDFGRVGEEIFTNLSNKDETEGVLR